MRGSGQPAAGGRQEPSLYCQPRAALILFGGLSVIVGLWPHVGAACIALFLIGVTPIMHNFWDIPDPAQRMMEMGDFTKNLALLGGALMMASVPRPWPYSLEHRRRIAA